MEKRPLKKRLRQSFLFCDYGRIWRLIMYYGLSGVKYLLPWNFYLDYVEVPITTRCNLRCADCANLMPLYEKPYDADSETVIRSIRKVSDCFDVCGEFRLLGGEPFLNPELKRFVDEIPDDKCMKISIPTNATVIPQDGELYEILRRKNVIIALGNYPSAADTQKQLIARLEQEGIRYEMPGTDSWINYGRPVLRDRDEKALKRQFARCNLRAKSLLGGVMYYCPRQSHGCDLGIVERKSGEYVDVLNNSDAQNRRQIRRLMWRHRPVEACRYCLRGTDDAVNISRGR